MIQKTRATLFQPIRCKTKINHNLVARVFPRFRQFGCVYFDFSLALQSIFFPLIGCWDYFDFSFTTLCQKAFYTKFQGLNMNKTGNMSLQVNKREKLTNEANISGQVVVLCSSNTLNFLIHPKDPKAPTKEFPSCGWQFTAVQISAASLCCLKSYCDYNWKVCLQSPLFH